MAKYAWQKGCQCECPAVCTCRLGGGYKKSRNAAPGPYRYSEDTCQKCGKKIDWKGKHGAIIQPRDLIYISTWSGT
jgi:hypothetical protein